MGAARALARTAEWVLPRVPPAWQGPISEVVGTIAYLAAPAARAAVRANLAMIAPERSLSARRVFVNQVRQYFEVFQIPRLDRSRFDAIVRVDGWDHFLCAERRGKGVIVNLSSGWGRGVAFLFATHDRSLLDVRPRRLIVLDEGKAVDVPNGVAMVDDEIYDNELPL